MISPRETDGKNPRPPPGMNLDSNLALPASRDGRVGAMARSTFVGCGEGGGEQKSQMANVSLFPAKASADVDGRCTYRFMYVWSM